MEFCIRKYLYVIMKAGKLVRVGGMELSSGEAMTKLEPGKAYNYLGILEADDIMHTKLKDKIQKEDYSRVES